MGEHSIEAAEADSIAALGCAAAELAWVPSTAAAGLESRPERCLISHPGTLGSISRRSNCSLSLPFLNVMKTKVLFHGNGVINQLIEIIKTTAQTRP